MSPTSSTGCRASLCMCVCACEDNCQQLSDVHTNFPIEFTFAQIFINSYSSNCRIMLISVFSNVYQTCLHGSYTIRATSRRIGLANQHPAKKSLYYLNNPINCRLIISFTVDYQIISYAHYYHIIININISHNCKTFCKHFKNDLIDVHS